MSRRISEMNKQIIKLYAFRMKLLNIDTEEKLAQLSGVPQATVHRIIKNEDYNPGCINHSKVLKVLKIPCPLNHIYTNIEIEIINNLRKLNKKHKEVILSNINSLQNIS